ncbi:MAG: DUF3089 domain-containing protein [Lachnospiraceae bacterium]|nr:DUF3089 domain-containing protein [Lachnospiraceae bacterium]
MRKTKQRILMCLMVLALVLGVIAPSAPASAATDAGTIVAKALKKLQAVETISFDTDFEVIITTFGDTFTQKQYGLSMSDEDISYAVLFDTLEDEKAWTQYGKDGIVYRKGVLEDSYKALVDENYREEEKTPKKSIEHQIANLTDLKIKKTSKKYYTITGKPVAENADEKKITLLISRKTGKLVRFYATLKKCEKNYLFSSATYTIEGGSYSYSNIGYSESKLSLPAEITDAQQAASRTYALYNAALNAGVYGIGFDGKYYYMSSRSRLAKCDTDMQSAAFSDEPFKGLEKEADTLVDLDVAGGEVYAGVQKVEDGVASNLQIAVYDAETLKLARSYTLGTESGQTDIAGIAVDTDNKCIWLSSSKGRYIYAYAVDTGAFLKKVALDAAPAGISGIAYYDGWIYITTTLGGYNLYRCQVDSAADTFKVSKERKLAELINAADTVGIAFDDASDRLILVSNGFYRYDMKVNDHPLDYSEAANWVSLPGEAELADPTKEADVFMVLPTINMNKFKPGNTDPTNLREALRFTKTFNMEKGILDDAAVIYSPLYRQTTIGSFLGEDGLIDFANVSDARKAYDDIAYEDIRNAWLYYMKNYNNGRPVVLFGYSQGGDMVKRLLEEFGNDSEFKDLFVCAYVIGSSIYEEDLAKYPHLKMAQGEKDTGVIISFNAVDARMESPDVKELSINPLNWKTDSTPAAAKKNLGMVTANTWGVETSETPAYCGAYIDSASGKLVVTDIEGQDELYNADNGVFRKGDYHTADLNMFYRNLEKNVQTRIKEFR